MKLILGSASARRKDLLAQIGVFADHICPPDIDESPHKDELPRPYCERIARSKAMAVQATSEDIVLCADTTVALGRRIMGKPKDAEEALAFLNALGGRRHRVITSLALRRGSHMWERTVVSSVKMKRLSKLETATYLSSNDWRDKAGGYAIQGPAGAFIPWISGSFSAIMGLPLAETANILVAAGYPLYKDAT
ncbi:Maf family protein [Pseudopelagicola sp. nBUS_19]|uniref:Maf family protein n=1 Tax=unclassified Pseudopelagicola TaxID=2649563 RepID=UPI003EBAC826